MRPAAIMRKFELIIAACLLLVGPAVCYAVELPPIDTPLPFGPNVITLPEPRRINVTSPRTVELLVEELERAGTTQDRKLELISDLARTQLPVAAVALRKAAADQDPLIRAAVAMGLGMLKDHGGHDVIARLAVDSDTQVRAEAVRAAGTLGIGDVVTRGLTDTDRTVVAAALSVCGADASANVTSYISSSDASLRVLAIDAVARGKIVSAAEAVAAPLQGDVDVPTKVAAAGALAALRSTRHAERVTQLLADVHPTVRREATAALPGVLAGAEVPKHAIRMLADSDETVRTAAAQVLATTPGPSAVGELVKQLSSSYIPLRDAARNALVATGDSVVPAAAKLLDDPDPRRREDGSYLLGALGSDVALERHIKLLDDTDWGVVAQAAHSLGQIAKPAAALQLQRTFDRALVVIQAKTPDSGAAATAAAHAAVSAAQLGHAPIGAKAANIIFESSTYPPNLRAAAMWAVGVVGARGEAGIVERLPALVQSPFEAEVVKIEAIKAVGNRKLAAGQVVFDVAPKVLDSAQVSAIIHWSKDRINGTVTPFTPPPPPYQAETSVIALPR
jgi:HEAT repeat protein